MPGMDKELMPFFNDREQVTAWPAKPKRQLLILQYLIEKFSRDAHYTEKQVNELLNEWHTFEDPALLRRELYMKHLLDRKADGSDYWRTAEK